MRWAAWKRTFAQPATRLAVVAWLVVTLVVAQFVLLMAGGSAAEREARNAREGSFVYFADISQERVVNAANEVEHLVLDTSLHLRVSQLGTEQLVGILKSELEHVGAADSVSVAYPNGEFVELRRSDTQPGGFEGYSVAYENGTVATRSVVEYDAELNVVSGRPSTVVFGTTSAEPYSAAVGASEPVWTGPSLDPATGRYVERVSLATRDGSGKVTMVVTANLSISRLQELLATMPSGSDGQISVLTGDRIVIMTPGVDVDGGEIRDFGTGATAVDAGVVTTARAKSTDSDVVASDGRYTTLERGLASEGLDWVIHVRVSASGLNEGFGRLKTTLNVVMGGLATFTVVLGSVLATLWRPLTAMREGAERDSLTGLYNRRRGGAAAQALVKFADRTGSRVVVVMFDLDHFKGLNDHHGHGAGDRALEAVGNRMVSQTRSVDVAVRWGGDEFLLALLLSPEDEASVVVERFRAGAADALKESFPALAELGVTAGFAVSDVVGDDVDALITAADHALVRGKTYGRGYSYSFTSPE